MYVRSVHKSDAPGSGTAGSTRSLDAIQVCQIHGCSREIPRRHLMCSTHWFEVPAELREQLIESLRSWLGGTVHVRPYLIFRLKAIIFVSKLHGAEVLEQVSMLARMEAAESKVTA